MEAEAAEKALEDAIKANADAEKIRELEEIAKREREEAEIARI